MTADDSTPVPELVERTGIALVHERDVIYPAKGSEALLRPLQPSHVNYHFPVVVEVIGKDTKAIAEEIYQELRMHIESLV
jgi:hypothetical protein